MNTVVIIAGPTASGKTDAAIKLAKHFNTSIISADSRQCFKELNIAVAKPSAAQLSEVHHYFINSHHITEQVTAADYERYALDAANEIFKTNKVAVICGGTGLYIKAFCEGLDEMPPVNAAVKRNIAEKYKEHGVAWLQQMIREEDPLFYQEGENQNPHRLIRALEMIRSSGTSVIELQKKNKKIRDFNIIKIALDLPREVLYERINQRVDKMMKAGLQEEAYELLPYKELNALQTVGYRELFDHFEHNISLDKAVDLIKQNTRNYAKRQQTWFRKGGFEWVNANLSPTDFHRLTQKVL